MPDIKTIRMTVQLVAGVFGIRNIPTVHTIDMPQIMGVHRDAGYVIYDPMRVRWLLQRHPWAAYFVLVGMVAHEVGHLLRVFPNGTIDEHAADIASGIALRKLGATPAETEAYIETLAEIGRMYGVIPSWPRAEAVRRGYSIGYSVR